MSFRVGLVERVLLLSAFVLGAGTHAAYAQNGTRSTDAIVAATNKYAHFLRLGDPDSVITAYADSGELLLPGAPPLRGRAAIRAFLLPMQGAVSVASVWMDVDRIEVDGSTVTSWGRYQQMAGPKGGPARAYTGSYDAVWVVDAAGLWKFKRLSMHPDP